jgi:hypothetical protein
MSDPVVALPSVTRLKTADGARITTHCLYPSFEAVHVYVVKVDNKFIVHDGGGAERASWLHGRDHHGITREINKQAERFHLENFEGRLVGEAISEEWLPSAILSVANASALAANNAVAKMVVAAESALITRIGSTLEKMVPAARIGREVAIKRRSGGERRFDFAIRRDDKHTLLINGVSPHHTSISSKYASFSDSDGDREDKLALHPVGPLRSNRPSARPPSRPRPPAVARPRSCPRRAAGAGSRKRPE